MSAYSIELPDRPEYDLMQQQRDEQDIRIRARMSRSAFLSDVQHRFADACCSHTAAWSLSRTIIVLRRLAGPMPSPS